MYLKENAVSPALLQTLRQLSVDPELKSFFLVGGTSLALRFGHRRSIDIDYFTDRPFDSSWLASHLDKSAGMTDISVEKDTVRGRLMKIKVDLIAHLYPLLEPIQKIEGIPMVSLIDLAAMKLNAIANRGSKKDFWDYALLLDHLRHREMLDAFSRKYAAYNRWHVEKAICFFNDAEADPDPDDLRGVSWDQIKGKIRRECGRL